MPPIRGKRIAQTAYLRSVSENSTETALFTEMRGGREFSDVRYPLDRREQRAAGGTRERSPLSCALVRRLAIGPCGTKQ